MNYTDIKDQVIEVTDNLSNIPGIAIWNMLPNKWGQYLPSNGAPLALLDITHPRIKCITHTTYTYTTVYVVDEWTYNYRVCSVLVDGKPAFYFVTVEELDQSSTRTFVLDMHVAKIFLDLIVELALGTAWSLPDAEGLSMSMYCAELVSESEEVDTYEVLEKWLHEDRPLPR